MNKKINRILNALASIQLTLFCLGLMMLLIFVGTLAQAKLGTFSAQRIYFSSFWLYKSFWGVPLPVFPGGMLIGSLWLVNLVAAFAVKFRYQKKDMGILLAHSGLILLLAGQGLTQLTTRESRLILPEGQTGIYVEHPRSSELAVVMTSEPHADQVVSIPESLLSRKKEIATPHLPFNLKVLKFYPNALLKMAAEGEPSLATQGVGARISVQEIPVTHKDDEFNNISAFVEIRDGETSLGTWLVSMALGAPQSFSLGGKEYKWAVRPKREYLPYQISLKDFRHDLYPGTDIPKNFSSLVHLRHPEKNEDRDVLIYMNHPLRYGGKTFYQASFAEENTVSIFQVVENPVWLAPYISCTLVILGLAIQFIRKFRRFK